MTEVEVVGGPPLRRAGVDDDGVRVPARIEAKSHMVGLVRFLEEVARKDQNPQYRRSARIHADILKGVYSPKNTTFEAETGLVIEAQPKRVAAKPPVVDVLDVKDVKDLSE